jgi:hypothetical protein
MEESVSNVLDALPAEHRALIEDELTRGNPALLEELRGAQKPTNDQSHAVVSALSRAMNPHFGPGYVPDERGKAIDNAVGAYLLAWPIYR